MREPTSLPKYIYYLNVLFHLDKNVHYNSAFQSCPQHTVLHHELELGLYKSFPWFVFLLHNFLYTLTRLRNYSILRQLNYSSVFTRRPFENFETYTQKI